MAGKNETSSTSSEMTWIIGAIVIGGVIYGLCYFFWTQIVMAGFAMKWWQIQLWAQTVGIGETGARYLDFVASIFDGRRDAVTVDGDTFVNVMETVGQVVKIPMAGIIGVMALIVYYNMKGGGFSTSYKLVPLLKYQATHWRTGLPGAVFNPDESSENMQPALNPVQWLHKLKLKARTTDANTVDEHTMEVCLKAFRDQLGLGWSPVPKLPLHVQCLVACFAMHGGGDKGALLLRQDVAQAYATILDKKKRDAYLIKRIQPVLANDKLIKPVLEKAERHAFISSALIHILKWVREESGVLASAEFLWLKEEDRPLWYAMNNVGRRAFHIECAGIYSHYFYEQQAQRPLVEPRVDNALKGLEMYLSEQGLDERDDI